MRTLNRNEAIIYVLEHTTAKLTNACEIHFMDEPALQILFTDKRGVFQMILTESVSEVHLRERVQKLRAKRQ